VKIRFWGVRGSISAPGPQTMRYGGNTPCVEFEGRGGETFVIDAGYGAVGLGQRLTQGAGATEQHLLLTHLHWDHIQGLPFFAPIYIPGHRVIIYSVSAKTARSAMDRLFTSVYSPIMGVENLGAEVAYEEIAGPFQLGDMHIEPVLLDHGVPTLGFRIEDGDSVVFHATDHEGGDRTCDERLVQAARGADLLIHDAQFTRPEYLRYRGWGHSHTEAALKNALDAQVRRLALFHYDPTHTDDDVDRQLQDARAQVADQELEVLAAQEGLELQVA